MSKILQYVYLGRRDVRVLKVRVAQVDITPRAGVQLAGGVGIRLSAQVVNDPLFSKGLVLERRGIRPVSYPSIYV